MEPRCNVAIVGCGLGGVAAAIAIRRAGHQVTIYEKAPALAEIGAGIQLPYNCTRILKKWNLLPLIKSISVRPSNVVLRAYRDGDVLYKRKLNVGRTLDTPHLLTHRADFLGALAQEAVRLGVLIQFNSTVARIDFSKPAIELLGHGEVEYDAIFGADGQKSFCRDTLLGYPDPPQLSGDLAYRIVIPVSEMDHDKELVGLLESFDISCWMGPHAHVVCYQLKELFNVVLIAPDSSSVTLDGAKTDMQEIEAILSDWDAQLRRLFQLAKGVLKRRLWSSLEMTNWSHPNSTFALIGDACHVSTPHLAQGAAQAVEDGAVLGELFARLKDRSQIKDLIRMYEAIRKPRTTSVILHSDARREFFERPNGETQMERDRQLKQATSFDGYPECVDSLDFQTWLSEYDTETEVEKAWQQYKQT